MNGLIEKGIIEELKLGTNLAYVLHDRSAFVSTEYKVLQNQKDSIFIKCMKLLYNGDLELCYLTENYKPFSVVLRDISYDRFIKLMSNLFSRIINVKNNGFLSCNNINCSFDHIFTDKNADQIYLLYLPLKNHEYPDDNTFEMAIRNSLADVVSRTRTLLSAKTSRLVSDLGDQALSVEQLQSKITCGEYYDSSDKTVVTTEPSFRSSSIPTIPDMELISLDSDPGIQFHITKSDFIIGKKETNDGVISNSRMVSRYHCKISFSRGNYRIIDLNSSNGTFVNEFRVPSDHSCELKDNDIIRLANVSFKVVIR